MHCRVALALGRNLISEGAAPDRRPVARRRHPAENAPERRQFCDSQGRMMTMTDTDLVTQSLEIAADRAGDINGAVYERYYSRCPASKQLMSHIDRYVQGRMLEEVIELLLTQQPETLRDYLRFETQTHVSYGVEPSMYENLLCSVRDAIRDAVAGDWNADYDLAWERRIAMLLAEISAATESTEA
jgi:hemoglobin-like flavoprotein